MIEQHYSLPATRTHEREVSEYGTHVLEKWTFDVIPNVVTDNDPKISSQEVQVLTSMLNAGRGMIEEHCKGIDARNLESSLHSAGIMKVLVPGNVIIDQGDEYQLMKGTASVNSKGDGGYLVIFNRGYPLRLVVNKGVDDGNREEEIIVGKDEFLVMVILRKCTFTYIPVFTSQSSQVQFLMADSTFGDDIQDETIKEEMSKKKKK